MTLWKSDKTSVLCYLDKYTKSTDKNDRETHNNSEVTEIHEKEPHWALGGGHAHTS